MTEEFWEKKYQEKFPEIKKYILNSKTNWRKNYEEMSILNEMIKITETKEFEKELSFGKYSSWAIKIPKESIIALIYAVGNFAKEKNDKKRAKILKFISKYGSFNFPKLQDISSKTQIDLHKFISWAKFISPNDIFGLFWWVYGYSCRGFDPNPISIRQLECFIAMILFGRSIPTYYQVAGHQIPMTKRSFRKLLICQDMQRLFSNQEMCDLKFKTKDNRIIEAHSSIIKLRFPKISLEELSNIISKTEYEPTINFLNWIYSGMISSEPELYNVLPRILLSRENGEQDSLDCPKFWDENDFRFSLNNILGIGFNHSSVKETIEIAEKMGILLEEFIEKSGRKGLMKDLKKYYLENESKNFSIIVNEKIIKAHKLILLSRSNLFRSMFLSVNDESNSVPETTGKSEETIRNLVKFFYTDSFESNVSLENLNELEECSEFFQIPKTEFFHERIIQAKLFIQEEEMINGKKKDYKFPVIFDKKGEFKTI
ncbi:pep-cterm sorting domain-containing protein [Anaeramoeba ignava]|uniref:Pep-cterm sorting domain-containing protein n=1 Tax=Anaeramoeba ignava TaxID=1746090 RepID=A0A9Q0L984_ANAIG|nr:pep-cterm sorting domain-containing protein [Anaeramoeba ignava]|eukprot:Anaeramoba_ignava/a222613_13.p1 GENE.a222613_13~~a222613_13.p1  ORF type:complete len:486 (-),score=175.49 a222613_13:2-1459(-)